MGNMALMRPYAPAAISVTNGAGYANLLTPDPKEAWLPPTATSADQVVELDLGSIKYCDCFYIGGLVPVGAAYTVYLSLTTPATGGTQVINSRLFPIARGVGESRDFVSFAGMPARYVSIAYKPINGASGGQASIGIARVGRQFVPTWGREWESGRQIFDTVNKERLMGGGFGLNAGVRKSGYDWTFGDLLDTELYELFDFLKEVGEGGPMIMVEDSTPPTAPTLVSQAGMSVAGALATKTGGAGFNSSVISSRSFKDSCLMLAVPSLTTKAMVLGINSDPLTDNAQTGIDYAFSIGAAATFTALESNTAQGAATAYASGPVFALAYDEGALRYAYNATVYRTVADIGANREFWLDTSFDTAAGAATINFYGPDGFAESIHYGLFNKIDKYARLLPNVSKWNLSMEEWV